MRRVICVFLVALIFTSCSKNSYTLIYVENGVLRKTILDLDIDNIESCENGYWEVENENKEILFYGNYSYSSKIGEWVYGFENNLKKIKWYEFTSPNMKISVPSTWRINTSTKHVFETVIPVKDSFNLNNYMVIHKSDEKSIDHYSKQYYSDVKEEINYLKQATKTILASESDTIIMMSINGTTQKEEINYNSILFSKDGDLFDLGMVSTNSSINESKTMIIEVLKSLSFNNERVFKPLKEWSITRYNI
ncbi:hypothetical protein [Brumimicrobium aurantiacum]|uniref:Uncharacterized protein n=1 Tax=Brumimicrobium aurantiacum TaxID=1737063 RepID=A0A3E1EZH1_9FLAO|nr:hypothetical protein [Brumimicrobium aurantiacum]RFC54969.1 hypothetical protein DXU93_03875 [Brumimicrobium aurantiacum]